VGTSDLCNCLTKIYNKIKCYRYLCVIELSRYECLWDLRPWDISYLTLNLKGHQLNIKTIKIYLPNHLCTANLYTKIMTVPLISYVILDIKIMIRGTASCFDVSKGGIKAPFSSKFTCMNRSKQHFVMQAGSYSLEHLIDGIWASFVK
jgi:hypothetical protein